MELNLVGTNSLQRKKMPLGILCFGSLKHEKFTLVNSNANGLDMIRFNITPPNNIALLVIIKKFDPNPILVNINKLKIYRTLDVASQKMEATTKGGRNNLMAIPHQNLVLEYISND